MSGILTKKSQVQGREHESETMDFPQNENTSLFPESIFYPSHARIPFYVIKFKNPFIRFYSIKPIPSYHYTVSHFLPLNTWSLHIYLKSLNGSENTDLGLGSYCYYIVYW